MNICKQCGVELENEMSVCPLCGTSVKESGAKDFNPQAPPHPKVFNAPGKERHLLQRVLWQVSSIILFSGIAGTLIIDAAVHKAITWSVYPVTVCAIIFSYASLLAFWHTRIVYQFFAGWLMSSLFLLTLNFVLTDARWAVALVFPYLLLPILLP